MGVSFALKQNMQKGHAKEVIVREETPCGTVIYREVYDADGNLLQRDVEHLVSFILLSTSKVKLEQQQKED